MAASTERLATPQERGQQWGAYYRAAGINYGKVNGHFPSNPYQHGTADAHAYDAGYVIGGTDSQTIHQPRRTQWKD